MNKLIDNKKGFGAIEGLLTVIAITLIVGVGFYVVNANKDDTKNTAVSDSDNTSKQTDKSAKTPSLNEAVSLAKDYYQFKYIDKWNEEVSQDQLAKWLTPGLIAELKDNSRADTGISPQASGFTKPDEVQVKGISSDDKTATVELTFAYTGNPTGSSYHTVTLEANNGAWLISKAQIKS